MKEKNCTICDAPADWLAGDKQHGGLFPTCTLHLHHFLKLMRRGNELTVKRITANPKVQP